MGLGSTLAQETTRAQRIIPPRQIKNSGWSYRKPGASLTPRLAELHQLVVTEGLTNQECGERMGLTEGSVKAMLCSVFKAFQVHSREQLILREHRSRIALWIARHNRDISREAAEELGALVGLSAAERWLD